MRINFFVEFPDHDFEKLEMIKFPSTIFIASKTLKNYEKYKKMAKEKGFETVWWPLSPFSYYVSPLMKLWEFKKLRKKTIRYYGEKILLDLEPPFGHIEKILTRAFYGFRNKRKIRKISKMLNEKNIKVYTAEFLLRKWPFISRIWGFSYPFSKMEHTKIIMYYTSLFKDKYLQWFPQHLKKLVESNPGKIQLALGVLASGTESDAGFKKKARPNYTNITPENLERDLNLCEKMGIKEVTLYRLGGLNDQYLKVIKKFI